MNLTKAKETKTRVCCLYRVSTKGQVDKAENDIPMQKKHVMSSLSQKAGQS